MGSLILPNFVINRFTVNATIDAGKLIRAIRIGVRMLDNIIDINKFPHKIYENYQKRFRTIGLIYWVRDSSDIFISFNRFFALA